MVLEMLDEAEVVTKTAYVRAEFYGCSPDYWYSEFARVFGIEFFSVISRGSQFKVESFMFRIGKPESFVFISPSKSQVRVQRFAKMVLNSRTGREAKRCRVYAPGHGAYVRILQEPSHCSRLPIIVSFNHDRLQLLLLYLSWTC